MELNIREGAQFTPALIDDAEQVLLDALSAPDGEIDCISNGNPPGAILAGPVDGYTCIDVAGGGFSNALKQGLIGITGSPSERCTGRLALTSAVPGSFVIAGCHISPNRFTDYINPSSDLSNYTSLGSNLQRHCR